MAKKGFIYALSNPSFKSGEKKDEKCIKIGQTTNLTGRIDQLSNTSVSEYFVPEIVIEVSDANKVEKLIHKIFKNSRVSPKREFFYVSLKQVEAAFESSFVFVEGRFLENEEIDRIIIANSDKMKKYDNISHELAKFIIAQNEWEKGPAGTESTYYQCFKIHDVNKNKIRAVIHDRLGKIFVGVETKTKNYVSYFEDVIIKNEDMIFSELGYKLSYKDHGGSNTYMAYVEFDKSEYNKDDLFSKVNDELIRIVNCVNKFIGDEYRK